MTLTTTRVTRPTEAVVLSAEEVDALPWIEVLGMPHISQRELWRSGNSVAGVMELAHGEDIEPHAHSECHHHIWVISGTCKLNGRDLGPGSYAHVPAGVDHQVVPTGDTPCRLLYLYLAS